MRATTTTTEMDPTNDGNSATTALGDKRLYLSKYEVVQIIAARVEQLLHGAAPLVPADECGGDLEVVAERELARRLLPIRVARRLPNGKVAVHSLNQFALPEPSDRGAAAR